MVVTRPLSRVGRCWSTVVERLVDDTQLAISSDNPWWQPARSCLLNELYQRLHQLDRAERAKVEPLLERLGICLAAGYTLRHQLPRMDGGLQRQWLGARWLWMHSAHLTDRAPWVAWVSSRVGRDGRACEGWPKWLSLQIRNMRSANMPGTSASYSPRYMYIPSTTLSPLAWPLVQRAGLPAVRVDLPSKRETLIQWLDRMLDRCSHAPQADVQRETISVSPLLVAPACESMHVYPLQDRLAVCWADRIFALSLREGGTTDRLLRARLHDTRFRSGSVFVAVDQRGKQSSWLDRGAVGWHLLERSREDAPSAQRSTSICRCTLGVGGPALVPWSAPLRLWRDDGFLVHCVRGDQGRSDRLITTSLALDAWQAGRHQPTSALERLLSIVRTGRVRSHSQLNRSCQATVSLSAVPLGELLSRRRFQSHLGRWDWEPYGLAISREAIEAINARPVIYGDDECYETLEFDERPYFQPMRWQSEREWRVVGDIRLHDLPAEAIRLFVATRAEAEALARHVPWPIVYDCSSPDTPWLGRAANSH